ncbi:MAG: hypothetical protein NWF01_06950 [Candidatus Bathyarchaeota archaeon]|nr:hypothetical protein [Candidatus Bathyarchaeota archaeon]
MNLLSSGPYGGDMELGSMISNRKLDCLIFFGTLVSLSLMMSMLKLFLE